MPLVAPLHRQYKTARTETRYHLLLKTGQMTTQTAASRGYVLFRSAIRDTHKSPKIVCSLWTHHVECSKLGKTQMFKDVRRGMVRNTGFCDQNVAAGCILELIVFSLSPYKTYAVLCFRNPAVIFRLRSPAGVSRCRTCRHHFPDVPVQTEYPHLPAVHRVCNTSVRYAG